MSDEIHIGNLIRSKLDEEGRTVRWFAKQIPYSRNNAYKLFDMDDLHPKLLRRISVILKFDFFTYYSESVRKEISENS